MKSRTRVFWIVFGVVIFHGVLFYFLGDKNPIPKKEFIPPPSFIVKEAPYTDPESGEKAIYREFTVSTKLAEPEAKSAEPPNPVAVTIPGR